MKQLTDDCKTLGNIAGDAIAEILALIKVGDWVVMNSQDEHIGSPDNVNAAYVRRFLELYLFYPYRATQNKTLEEAEQILQAVMSKAESRIGKSDTLGLFETPEEYMWCVNALCVDIARIDHSLQEADFQYMIEEHDLTSKAKMQPFYTAFAKNLQAQLDGGAEEDDSKAQDEAAEAEKVAFERKKTQQEAILSFLAQ